MTQKPDLRERCTYLLILFKAKDKTLFEKYTAQLAKISAEESTDFYNSLLAEYKKLVDGSIPARPQKPAATVSPKEVIKKKAAKKVVKKKAPAKKVIKKVVAKPKKKTKKKSR